MELVEREQHKRPIPGLPGESCKSLCWHRLVLHRSCSCLHASNASHCLPLESELVMCDIVAGSQVYWRRCCCQTIYAGPCLSTVWSAEYTGLDSLLALDHKLVFKSTIIRPTSKFVESVKEAWSGNILLLAPHQLTHSKSIANNSKSTDDNRSPSNACLSDKKFVSHACGKLQHCRLTGCLQYVLDWGKRHLLSTSGLASCFAVYS